MEVIKFGGAVLKSKAGFHRMLEILQGNNINQVCVVISAFSKSTRELGKLSSIAESGDEIAANKLFDDLLELHIEFSADLLINKERQEKLKIRIQKDSLRIKKLIRGVAITRELTMRTLDSILAFGEQLALIIVEEFLLENNFSFSTIESLEIIATDSSFGKAKPNITLTKKNVQDRLLPLLQRNRLVITQGFIARNDKGETTTMGMESSNLTAALLAELLGAESLTIWTDVPGICTADPKYIPEARTIARLSYDEALRAANCGLKLVHPGMIIHAGKSGFKLIFRDGTNDTENKTEIGNEIDTTTKPIIIMQDNCSLIRIKEDNIFTHSTFDYISRISSKGGLILQMPDSISIIAEDVLIEDNPLKGKSEITKDISLISIIDADITVISEVLAGIENIIPNSKPKITIIDSQSGITRIIIPMEESLKVYKQIHKRLIEIL